MSFFYPNKLFWVKRDILTKEINKKALKLDSRAFNGV